MEEDMATKKEIDAMSFRQLKALMDQAEARMQDMRQQELADARAKIQEMAADLGMSIYALVGIPEPQPAAARGRPKGNGTGKPAKVAFRLPDGTEWGGRGRPSEAIKAFVGPSGVNENHFLTEEGKAKLEPYRLT
jgi:DNA-binding protein H-NS